MLANNFTIFFRLSPAAFLPKNAYNIHHNPAAMKKVVVLLPLLLILLLASDAGAAAYFRITNVSPIYIVPNSEANFTVDVKSLGPDGEYVQLIFKNLTPGLSIDYAGGLRYVVPTGTRLFNCSMRAGNVAPGNYTFDIGIYAQDAKTNWREAYAIVEPTTAMQAASEVSNVSIASATANMSAPQTNRTKAKAAPALGISASIFVIMLLAAKRRG
jgi:hypothetical protein